MSKQSGLGTALSYKRIVLSALAGLALSVLAMLTAACLIDIGRLSAESMSLYAYICVFAGECAAAIIAPAGSRRLLCSLMAVGILVIMLAAAGMLLFSGVFDATRLLVTVLLAAAAGVFGSIISSFIR